MRDIEAIMALDTVDGFQMGPGDLSMTSGHGAFSSTDADWADIERCVDAAVAAGKTWLYPAWTHKDQEWALQREAPMIMIGIQYNLMHRVLREVKDAFDLLHVAGG